MLESGFDFNYNNNQTSQNYHNISAVSGNFGMQGGNTITSLNNLSKFNSFSTHNNI